MTLQGRWAACAHRAVVGLAISIATQAGAQAPEDAAPSPSIEVAQQQDALLDRRIKVEIGAQSVATAVIELSKLAGVQLVMRAGGLHELSTPGLRGNYSLRDALTQLLSGTGHTFHKIDTDIIGIDPPAAPGPGAADASDAAPLAMEVDPSLPAATIDVTSIETGSEMPATSGVADVPDGVARLDDVIVTATKRAQSVRKIPSSINALNGDELEKVGAREMQDYLKQVPGIVLVEASGDKPAKIAIRGVGPSMGANQTTGVLLDDVPLTDPYGSFPIADPDPFDMRTVEILKGPQGTLFGASALNGAIRFVQEKPELGSWSGRGFAEWLSINQGGAAPTFGAALNAPIGESIALRASGVVQHTPGYIDFVTPNHPQAIDGNDVRKWSGRLLARWDVGDKLSLNASYFRQQRKTTENSFTTNADGQLERDNAPGQSPLLIGFSVASLDARYDLGWASLVSVTSRQTKATDIELEATYTLVDPAAMAGISLLKGFQQVNASGILQEVRLVSPDGGLWNWLAGVYYNRYTADIDIDLYATNTGVLQSIPLLTTLLDNNALVQAITTSRGISVANQSYHPLNATDGALFGEVSRRLFDTLNLTLGARLYKVELDGDTATSGALTLATKQSLRSVALVDVAERGFSPKLAATWQVSPDVLIYGNASRGFQYGGINIFPTSALSSDHSTFKSSTLWNYEIGARTDWLDRTLRLDLTVFHLDWKRPQVYQADSSPGGLNGSYIDNVGAAAGNGVEGAFRYLTPVPGLSLDLAGSYIILKTAADFDTASGTTIPSGTEMPLSPRVQGSTNLNYTRNLGEWVVGAGAGYQFQGRAFSNVEHSFEVGGYSLINLNFNIARPDLEYAPTLTLICSNLGDERGITGINGVNRQLPSGVPTASFPPTSYVRPRSISLRVTARF